MPQKTNKGTIRKGVIMYFINVFDKVTEKSWRELFDSYHLFRKRVVKLKYSKKLVITSRSCFVD